MKIRVGVFFGGQSVEHEVSVISGLQALAALDRERYQPIPIYVTKQNDFYFGPEAGQVESYRNLPALLARLTQIDLLRQDGRVHMLRRARRRFGQNSLGELDVALLVFHGTAGEDGVMQGLFERLGLPYTGCDVAASSAGMDKWTMKALFAAAGLPHLPALRIGRAAYLSDSAAQLEQAQQAIGLPCIVKPVNLGSSVGISRADSVQQLEAALETAFEYAHVALVERAITPLREINCAVLGDSDELEASVCEEPLLAGDVLTFQDKYQRGGGSKGAKNGAKAAPAPGGAKRAGAKGAGMSSLSRQVPADISAEQTALVRDLAGRAFRAIGAAGVARVDFLMHAQSGEIWVNEINTIPGSLSFYLWEAGGMSFTQLLDRMIALALKRERDRARISFSFETNLLENASLGGAKSSKT